MNKQKSKRQRLLLSILMVLSIVLLSSFVIFWLAGQYRIEKNRLSKDLNNKYIKSRDQVLDSFLISTYITPILEDSVKHTKTFTSGKEEFIKTDSDYHFKETGRFYAVTINDSINEPDILNHNINISDENYYDDNHKASGRFFSITVNKDSITDEHINEADIFLEADKEEVLLRSIKLIVHSSGSYPSEDSINNFMFSKRLDDDLFMKLFGEYLEKDGFEFELEWVTDEADQTLLTGSSGIILNANSYYNLPAVIINHFTFHILSLLFGQILFALFLISFSAFAFIFAYRSLKKQIVLNTLRNDFVSNISHELKTPISTINVALEAIKKYNSEKNSEKIEEYTTMMSDEVKRFDLLISKVLNHSILEDNNDVLKLQNVSIIKIIDELTDRIQLQNPDVNISSEYESTVSEIFIDPLFISGVLFNLIDNSIKYFNNKNEENSEIRITTVENSHNVIVIVKDNGPGIPEQYISRLFDKFFRVPTGNKHNVKGYGLGLSFAKLVMELHKGSIDVENNSEGGCAFILKFRK